MSINANANACVILNLAFYRINFRHNKSIHPNIEFSDIEKSESFDLLEEKTNQNATHKKYILSSSTLCNVYESSVCSDDVSSAILFISSCVSFTSRVFQITHRFTHSQKVLILYTTHPRFIFSFFQFIFSSFQHNENYFFHWLIADWYKFRRRLRGYFRCVKTTYRTMQYRFGFCFVLFSFLFSCLWLNASEEKRTDV